MAVLFSYWCNKAHQKSESVKTTYKSAAVRAFYLDFARARACALALYLTRDLARALGIDSDLNLNLDFELDLDLDFDRALTLALIFSCDLALDRIIDRTIELELKVKIESLKSQLPSTQNMAAVVAWWKSDGTAWQQSLRAVMIEHRNIGHDWQFSEAEKEKLKQYYDANKLLVDCLNSDCYVTKATRQEIEDTLLLPLAEIENRAAVQKNLDGE